MKKPESGRVENEFEFIDSIKRERDKGYSFVPLTGAGLSAPSGVPIIKEIHQYLIKCIAFALGVNRPYDNPIGTHRYHFEWRWHPQRDDWPPIRPAQSYRGDKVPWIERIADSARDMIAYVKANPSNWDRFPETEIFHEAYGATADWATSLLFLARLREDADKGQLKLGSVDPIVIDNFFLNVVLGKKPTIGHRMLARLTGPLRINTTLTMNFEDLIERAHEQISNDLTTYAVHYDSGLPAYHSRFANNTLIKLHGDRYGLRADYSVNDEPSDDDCRHFASYLAGTPIDRDSFRNVLSGDSNLYPCRSHLLVTGLSGKEDRSLTMIKRANQALGGLKVFWIGYTDSDWKYAFKRLGDYCKLELDQIHVTQSHWAGLLFFNMYQQLYGAMPPDGAIFPSQSRVPVPPMVLPLTGAASTVDLQLDYANKINDAINNRIEVSEDSDQYRLVLADRDDTASSASISYHNQLDWHRQAIWIDLDEIVDTDDLFESMLAAIARKAGITDWIPVLAQSQDEFDHDDPDQIRHQELMTLRQQELARLTNNPDRKWVIYLNSATSPAGSNFWPVKDERWDAKTEVSNGWIDYEQDDPSREKDPDCGGDDDSDSKPVWTDCRNDFYNMIIGICQSQCPNITFVLVCKKHSHIAKTLLELSPTARGRAIAWAVPKGEEQEKELEEFDKWLLDDRVTDIEHSQNKASRSLLLSTVLNNQYFELKGEQLMEHTEPSSDEEKSEEVLSEYSNVSDVFNQCIEGIPKLKRFEKYILIKSIEDRYHFTVDEKIGSEKFIGEVMNRTKDQNLLFENYNDVLTWISSNPTNKTFLRAFVAVNRVRPPSLMWTAIFHREKDAERRTVTADERMKRTKKILGELHEKNLIGYQDGGFVWINGRLRRMLRNYFQQQHDDPCNEKAIGTLRRSIEVHEGLAKWYARLHVSSISERAATESVYHRAIQAELIFELIKRLDSEGAIEECAHYARWALQAIGASLRILRQAKPSILASGYTQGTQRRLEELGKRFKYKVGQKDDDTGVFKAIEPLKQIYPEYTKRIIWALNRVNQLSLTMNMDVAREIGDLAKAEKKWRDLYKENSNPVVSLDQTLKHNSDEERQMGVWQAIRKQNRYATLGIAKRNNQPREELKEIRQTLRYPMIEYSSHAEMSQLSDHELRDCIYDWLNESVPRLVERKKQNPDGTGPVQGA